MKYISAKEAASQWSVSIQMVRRYCQKGLIPQAIQEDGGWRIPEGTEKPNTEKPKKVEATQSSLVNKIKYQRSKNNHFGIYEYIQVNLAYSSSRMASNRLTREQVQDMYRTNRLTGAFEPTKVDDIIEVMNHFICTKEMVDTIMEPLTPELIRRYHYCNPSYFIDEFKKCLAKVEGIPILTPHSCRVTYVSIMQYLGVKMETISKLCGHTTTKVTNESYLRIHDEVIQDAVGRIDNRFGLVGLMEQETNRVRIGVS